MIDMLIESKVCQSKREAREFLKAGTITINGNKVSDEAMIIDKRVALYDEIIVLRRGKKKYYIGNLK